MKLVITGKELLTLEKVLAPCKKPWQSESLRIAVFSDYRVQDIPLLLEFLKSLNPPPDLLLYAGDDVERFQEGERNFFEELAATATHGLCAVVGNDSAVPSTDSDKRVRIFDEVMGTRAFIKGKNVHNVHCEPVLIGKYAVVGIEGSPLDDRFGALGTVVYPEVFIARHLQLAAKAVKGKNLIVVSHTPPRGVLDFAIRFGKRRIGSKALRQFISKRRDVSLVVCGHVHYCGAQSQKLGRSTVVNAASHDDPGAPGRVAVLQLQSGRVRSIEWQTLWELGSLPGIGSGRESRLRDAGIRSVRQLAESSAEYISKSIKGGIVEGMSLKSRAASLLKGEVIQVGPFSVPTGQRAYLDVETDMLGKFIWLVGVHLEQENKTFSFYADTPKQERLVLTNLLDFLKARPSLKLLSYSGCRMEQRMLNQRLAAYRLPIDVAQCIRDLYFDIHASFAFPTQRLTLKDVARYCGFEFRASGMDGFDAALIYGSGKLTTAKKKMVIKYNEDDLLALKCVVRHLDTFCVTTQGELNFQ
jgi:Icc-related predicted phosphoesterase/uncharacterized protein YprB with RNaseH-like and TPR domain